MSDSEDGAAQRSRSRAREAALKKIKDRKERDRRGTVDSEDEVLTTSDKRKELQRKRMQSKLPYIIVHSPIYLLLSYCSERKRGLSSQ